MQNWTNSFNVFILAMTALIIGLQSNFLREAGERLCDWTDETIDDINEIEDFGFIEQDFNK